jgi:SPP1 gp7 family putative phage head morphogenesis protein
MPRKRPKIVPMKYPVGQEFAYRKILLNMNRKYKQILKRNMSPYVEIMAKEATAVHLPTGQIRQDALGWQDQLNQIMQKIATDMRQPTNQAIKEMLRVGPQVNQYNKAEWTRLIRSQYGVDPTKERPEQFKVLLENWSRNNSLLIKDIPHKTSLQIAEQTRQALIDGTNLKDAKEAVFNIMSERTDVSDSRAKLIARDQIAKLNGQLTMERQVDMGVDSYIWRTVGDERVRDTHADNEDQTFTWDNPPAETGHPGDDYQCRCWAEPILPEFLEFQASLLEEADA